MLSRISLLLAASLFTLTTKAQDLPGAVSKQINITKTQDIPAPVSKWINAELAKGKNKTLLNDYTADRFFSKDSSRIIGYIKGYDTTLKFTSGIIYMENVITREDYPTVVRIHPDGRFEATLKMIHPKSIGIFFEDSWVPVYVEPGQVNAMVLDWNIIKNDAVFNKAIGFQGPAAQLNKELNSFRLERPDYDEFQRKVKTLTSDEFKAAEQQSWENEHKKLEAELAAGKYLEQTKTILRNRLDLDHAINLLDFISNRNYERNKDTANKILAIRESISYYDFLSKNNFNRQELLLVSNFSTFINKVEFSKPYRESNNSQYAKASYEPGAATGKFSPMMLSMLRAWQVADTLLPNKYGITPDFIYEMCKTRQMKFVFEKGLRDKKDDARAYLTEIANTMHNPVLLNEAEALFHRSFSDGGRTYTLPDNKSAAIFKKIINRHKGKMLFVDFWSTSCGPCIANIKTQLPLRAQYKNNPDFDFVFITSEDESPEKAYGKFINEQALEHTYRINSDDYLSLRELFKFNGIPRYVVIDKEGKVLNDDFQMHNFPYELPKLFPGKEWQ